MAHTPYYFKQTASQATSVTEGRKETNGVQANKKTQFQQFQNTFIFPFALNLRTHPHKVAKYYPNSPLVISKSKCLCSTIIFEPTMNEDRVSKSHKHKSSQNYKLCNEIQGNNFENVWLSHNDFNNKYNNSGQGLTSKDGVVIKFMKNQIFGNKILKEAIRVGCACLCSYYPAQIHILFSQFIYNVKNPITIQT